MVLGKAVNRQATHSLHLMLTKDEATDLQAAKDRTGLTAAALFRRFLRETAHARKLETQGRRKVELDSGEDLVAIERLLIIARGKAEADGAAFRDTRDPVRRTIYHEDLRRAMTDVAWLEDLASKLRDAQQRVASPDYRMRIQRNGVRTTVGRQEAASPSQPAAAPSSAQGEPLSAT